MHQPQLGETKYAIGDTVWFIKGNESAKGTVTSVCDIPDDGILLYTIDNQWVCSKFELSRTRAEVIRNVLEGKMNELNYLQRTIAHLESQLDKEVTT